MCGEVIEHEAKRILNRGIAQGQQLGREEILRESYQKLISQIGKKINKGKSISQIADDLEDEESNIRHIVNIMEECGMENVEEIVERLLVK